MIEQKGKCIEANCQIPEILSKGRDRVNDLDNIVGVLEDRLNNLLTEAFPEPEEVDKKISQPLVIVATDIKDIVETVRLNTARIQSIINRLEN